MTNDFGRHGWTTHSPLQQYWLNAFSAMISCHSCFSSMPISRNTFLIMKGGYMYLLAGENLAEGKMVVLKPFEVLSF